MRAIRAAGLAAGHVWSAPLTIAGLLVAMAAGARPRAASAGALDVVAPGRGPLAWFFRAMHVRAYTWGATIVYRDEGCRTDAVLRSHERAHVRQCLALGPAMPLLYVLSSLWQVARGRHAYRDNAFEVAARAREKR